MDKTTKTTTHYQGEAGNKYFDAKFDGRMSLGRQFQAEYFLPFCNESLVLVDFGCGDGTTLRNLPAKQKFGVEINPACHEKIENLNKSVDVPIKIQTDLSELESETADLVTSNHCLEHVPSPLESLQQVCRVLKPGGTFVLVVPFDDWRTKQNRDWVPDDTDQHLFTWCPRSLGNIMLRAGFEIQSCRVSSQAWSPRFFFVDRYFGRTAFKFACNAYSWLTNRREVVCVARKGHSQ
jgi:SAM-dependent methyltransferase